MGGIILVIALSSVATTNVRSLFASSNTHDYLNELNSIANDIQEIHYASTKYLECDPEGLITTLRPFNNELAPDIQRSVSASSATEITVIYTRISTQEQLQQVEHFPAACDRYLF